VKRDLELERALRGVAVPGEDEAEERAWEIVRAAHAERVPVRPTRRTRGFALAFVAGAVALAIGLSPAGAKVGDLVSDMVGVGEPDARPALRSLPSAGELLVESDQGPWIVREDGSKRLLGDYGQATWSPHGLFVAVTEGRELLAVDPLGNVRWTIDAPGPVHDPRWSPSGFRIAYRSGDDLRVVAGDGTGDRLVAHDVAPIPPAWRPIGDSKIAADGVGGHVLTYVDGDGSIRTVDVDAGQRVPTTREDHRLLEAPATGEAENRALSPDGSRVARLEHVGARDRLIVAEVGGGGSVLFSARGVLTGPTWSPDGHWLLVGWPQADQWLFIRTSRPGRVIAINHISGQFDPGGSGDAGFPRVSGWILPQR
jgi:hypothetical protein